MVTRPRRHRAPGRRRHGRPLLGLAACASWLGRPAGAQEYLCADAPAGYEAPERGYLLRGSGAQGEVHYNSAFGNNAPVNDAEACAGHCNGPGPGSDNCAPAPPLQPALRPPPRHTLVVRCPGESFD